MGLRCLHGARALAIALGVSACQPFWQVSSDRMDLVLQPTLLTGRVTQAVVSTKSAADIRRLDILPFVEAAANVYMPLSTVTGLPTDTSDPAILKVSQVAPGIDFNRTITIHNLKANTRYRIFAQAYDASDALISTTDGYSYVEVAIGRDNAPQLPVRLPVKLVDTLFAAHTGVTVTATGATNRLAQVMARLHMVINGTEVPLGSSLSVAKAELPRIVALANLQADTVYRLKTRAVDSQGAELAAASVDVGVSHDDAPASRSVQLSIGEYPLSAGIGQ